MKTRLLASINAVAAKLWDPLFAGSGELGNPFLKHAFLAALEDTGCVGGDSGWRPCHLLLSDADGVAGALPMYAKSHSYGEFVFDWSWAQAYQRHGLAYYPKLLSAVPFTPSMGPRLGVAPGRDAEEIQQRLIAAAIEHARATDCSGWHLLFPHAAPEALAAHGMLQRQDVQFHWQNRGYASFDDFLAQLKSSRRKNLRRERRRVLEQGVQLSRFLGAEISDADWDGFYRCYVSTYLKRSGHGGYLNREFFTELRRRLSGQLLLVVARRAGRMLAGALFLFDQHRLYGRYWGALEEVECLHFEACYYQGIEFCIERGQRSFDPGTQGEHKLLRGFEPVTTQSWHWIADPRFRTAIADFLAQERAMTDDYGQRAAELLPYRDAAGGAPAGAQDDAAGQSSKEAADQSVPGARKTS